MSECTECGRHMHDLDAQRYETCAECAAMPGEPYEIRTACNGDRRVSPSLAARGKQLSDALEFCEQNTGDDEYVDPQEGVHGMAVYSPEGLEQWERNSVCNCGIVCTCDR